MRSVLLIGLKHTGKSTLAVRLSAAGRGPVVDTDRLVEDTYAARTGETKTVREIFGKHGPEFFADLERSVVRELADRLDHEGPAVVALGGATALREDLHPLLRQMGAIVHLRAPQEVLLERILAGGLPPFLDADDPAGSFAKLAEQRLPVYDALAEIHVDLGALDPYQAAAAVLEAVEATEA